MGLDGAQVCGTNAKGIVRAGKQATNGPFGRNWLWVLGIALLFCYGSRRSFEHEALRGSLTRAIHHHDKIGGRNALIRGADPNAFCDTDMSAGQRLWILARWGKWEPQIKTTPLQLVCRQHQTDPELAQLLLTFGAKANQADSFGDSPLYLAILSEHDQVAILLVRHGADVNAMCGGQHILCAALYSSKDPNLVETLLDHGASPNLSDGDYTPLSIAINSGNARFVRCLLMHHADPNQGLISYSAYSQGRLREFRLTPLKFAEHQKMKTVANLLRNAGAK